MTQPTTISGLPDATGPLTGAERVPIDDVAAGVTKDCSTLQIANLAASAISSAVAAHVAAADPHPGYLTAAEGDAAYATAAQGGKADTAIQGVTGTAPIVSSGGATPAISISAATTSAAGSMSSADKTKLDGIAAGAEVNVNADWNASSGDAQILNKPSIPAPADAAPAALAATAAIGSSTDYAREDHAHQRDSDVIVIPVGDETTALTTGTNLVRFRMPFAATLLAVRAAVNTAPTGSTLIVDVNEAGSSVLGTKLSIDASELTSTTAASAATITDSSLADDAEISIDIDQIGSTVAGAGLKVSLFVRRA
jgi:hypothetical protein